MERQFENLIREAKIKKGLVVYGNTRDEYFYKGKYVLLPEYIRSVLKENGFDIVGTWNRVGGMSFGEAHEKSVFSRWFKTNSCNNKKRNPAEDAVDYDLGEEEKKAPDGDEMPPLRDFDEAVAGLIHVMDTYDRPCAFVLDWTDYQFGTVQTPMAQEDRRSIEGLSLLMTGAHGTGSTSNIFNRPPGVIILITANLGSIPPAFYQPESRVKLFNITLPEKSTRTKFFEEQLESLNLKSNDELTRRQIIDTLSDMSDGMRTVDLIQIVRLAGEEKNLTSEKLFNLYRFGERKSPWEDLSDQKLDSIRATLKKRVIGQDHAIEYVENSIIKAAMGLSGVQHSAKMSKPKGIMFFVGPTGVGKTELAKATAEFLFGDEEACIRFDMSEYSHEESDQRLIGAPPGYVGFEEGGQLINAVLKRPFSVLLFDEIEKAHPRILDKFLQVLEDGRLTDGRGVTAYFSETVIIFTSNIGASEVKLNQDIEDIEREYRQKVKEHFNVVLKRPELLNRIGNNIVVFNAIEDKGFRKEIIKRKLKPLSDVVKEKYGVGMLIDDKIYSYLENFTDSSHGGRGLLNAADTRLINPLSIFLFKNKQFLTTGRTIKVSLNQESNAVQFSIMEG